MFIFKALVKSVMLPPGIFIVLIICSLAVMLHRKRLGLVLGAFSVAFMLILSMPAVSGLLIQSIISHPPLDLPSGVGDSQAIVVLTGGINREALEYRRDVASSASLVRGRFAAYLHNKTKLPIMVVGGMPKSSALSEAEAMEKMLEEEFHIPVKWVEPQAKDTEESAVNSFKMLSQDGIVNILLVTQIYHMRRAELVFSNAGFKVTPAPMGFRKFGNFSVFSFLPSAGALSLTSFALNEWYGIAWSYLKRILLG